MSCFGDGTPREKMRNWLIMEKEDAGMSWPEFMVALSQVLASFAEEMAFDFEQEAEV